MSASKTSPASDSIRFNIFLTPELHKQLKILAAMEGSTMQQLVEDILMSETKQDMHLVRALVNKRKQ